MVIDKGKLRYDGDVATLVATLRPDKRVALRLAPEADRAAVQEALARVGQPVSPEAAGMAGVGADHAVAYIAKDRLREAVGFLLGALPVLDLTIEDPPLEEVLGDLLARPMARNDATTTATAPVAETPTP